MENELSGDEQATAEELLKELAEELAGYPVCPLCSRLQWQHKMGCIMPEVYERFGIEPKDEDYKSDLDCTRDVRMMLDTIDRHSGNMG